MPVLDEYLRAPQPCPYCGVDYYQPLNTGSYRKQCGAPDCVRKLRNAAHRRWTKTCRARARKYGLCGRCCYNQPRLIAPGVRDKFCRACQRKELLAKKAYREKLPEKAWAQARTIALAELTFVEPIRKKLPPPPPAGPPIEV